MSDQDKEELKMLGALVPEELFWKFKKAASERKEKMAEAIMNAAELYLAVDGRKYDE